MDSIFILLITILAVGLGLIPIVYFLYCDMDVSVNSISKVENFETTNKEIEKDNITNSHVQTKNSTSNKCTSNNCGNNCGIESGMYPVMEPEFNMREVSKQCLLLEDHLNTLGKRCYDCIRKHFLMIDGLLEEAVSLEKDTEKRKYYRELHKEWVEFEKNYSLHHKDIKYLDKISKEIRMFRKPLVEQYFDLVSRYSIN